MSAPKKLADNPATIVCITQEHVPNLTCLPPAFEYMGKKFIIHSDPNVLYLPKLVANFDYFIDASTNRPTDEVAGYQAAFGKKYIQIPWEDKLLQQLKLNNIVRQFNLENVRLPVTFDTKRSFSNYGGVGTHIVKRINGAKGNNQALVPSHLINDFVSKSTHGGGLPVEELKTEFSCVIFSKMDDPNSTKFFEHQPVLIQEYLPIVEEWRLMFAEDYIIGYKRDRRDIHTGTKESETGLKFIQANLASEDKRELVCQTPLILGFSDDEIKSLQTITTNIGIHIGSIDVCRLDNGKLSILEYSREFAYANINPGVIADLYKKFIYITCL